MAMDNFVFIDTEICEPRGKMNQERLPKETSLGSEGRKKLSDITNSQQHSNSHSSQDDKLKRNSITAREYIEQLQKENVTLKQLLLERNKLIELTGEELSRMRHNMQKMDLNNRQLAQANAQMTLERNLDKDRLKTLHHEIGCQRALLAAKDQELQQEKLKKKPSQKHRTAKKTKVKAEEDGGADTKPCSLNQRHQTIIQPAESSVVEQVEAMEGTNSKRQSVGVSALEEQREAIERANDQSEEVEGNVQAHGADKPCNLKGKGRQRTLSLGCSAANDQVTSKEKPCNKRQSARFNLEREATDVKPDSKKSRQSCKFQPTEDTFEIDDTISPMCTSVDKIVEKKEGRHSDDTPAVRRSIGRPVRSAAVKVPSYKETPLNVKMRRSE